MIRISDLSYHYQNSHREQIVALRDINLTVRDGEFLAVLGHNGCGKTTLAKHINGLLLPSKGSVAIDGLSTSDPAQLWKIRQKVGLIFQNPENQIVGTLVEEDVAFGPENLSLPQSEIRNRVKQALDEVGMQEFAKSEPHLLSAGQQQKVTLAGIVAMRPGVIVLDEPTSMLDPAGTKDVLRIIRDLNRKRKMTVIYITHFVEEVIDADRVIVMENGRIFLEGSPKEIFSSPMRLRDLGINPLVINQLAVGLARAGLNVDPKILTVEEMVKALCSLS